MSTRIGKYLDRFCRSTTVCVTCVCARVGGVSLFLLAICPLSSTPQESPGTASSFHMSQPQYHPAIISGIRDEEFDLLYEDRYFYIDNQGLARVHVVLNGHRFKLASDPAEVQQGSNTYQIPPYGEMVIDLVRYMRPQGNRMWIHGEGPPGTEATIIVADQVFGGVVHHVLKIDEVPQSFSISQNYPNPFNPSTKITYFVPDQLIAGADVFLAVYSLAGERIKVLVDDRRFPGTFTVQWNGDNDRGELTSSGVYLYQITAGMHQMSRKLVLLR